MLELSSGPSGPRNHSDTDSCEFLPLFYLNTSISREIIFINVFVLVNVPKLFGIRWGFLEAEWLEPSFMMAHSLQE